MHLTNYSINKMSERYVRPSEQNLLEANDATKRTLASLRATMDQKGINSAKVFDSIRDTSSKIMEIFAPMLLHNLKALQGKK